MASAGLWAATACQAGGQLSPQATAPADLHMAAAWCAPAPATWVTVVWTNRGSVALALWPWTDTDTGPQHDALQIERGAWSAALIAPRKHAAARWCTLAPGQQHAVTIDLAAWQQRLLAPGPPRSGWQLAYRVAPGPPGLPERWPACGAGGIPQPVPAAAWAGRLVAPIAPADAGKRPGSCCPTTRPGPHAGALSDDHPSAGPCGSPPPAARPG